jgi:hypothetical protein
MKSSFLTKEKKELFMDEKVDYFHLPSRRKVVSYEKQY